uniref:Nuclear factor of kappa light polypeptide gene enhancer in B-cells inhibitor, epsilon n=1 Tax=Scleropages formosus TaxID=113540 RepID=A0A8C9RHK6_SCLFO
MMMANKPGDEGAKVDLGEDSRVDSGIECLKSLNKEDQGGMKAARGPSSSDSDSGKDKVVDNVAEERVDSAYSSAYSSAFSMESLMEQCRLSEPEAPPIAHETQGAEEDSNLLATITEDGDTILHLAIIHEESEFAQQLIDLFPKDVLDIQNNLYQTPLHLATYLNLPMVVRDLVQKKASVELQDQDGNTALHVACEQGRMECAGEMTKEISMRQFAEVLKMQNWRGLTCLHLAALHKNYRLMKFLMKKGADLNVQEGTSGKTALHLAVELHDEVLVTLLLNKGANVDAAMFNGCTALHLAVGRQDATIAHLLCQSGADKMLRNMEDETALDLADGNDDVSSATHLHLHLYLFN